MTFFLLFKAHLKGWFSPWTRGAAALLGPCALLFLLDFAGKRFRADYLLADQALAAALLIGLCFAQARSSAQFHQDARSGSLRAKARLPMRSIWEYLSRIACPFVYGALLCALLWLCVLASGASVRLRIIWCGAAMLCVLFHASLSVGAASVFRGAGQRWFDALMLAEAVLLSGAVVSERLFSEAFYGVWRFTPSGSFKLLLSQALEGKAALGDWLVPAGYALFSLGFSLLFFRLIRKERHRPQG